MIVAAGSAVVSAAACRAVVVIVRGGAGTWTDTRVIIACVVMRVAAATVCVAALPSGRHRHVVVAAAVAVRVVGRWSVWEGSEPGGELLQNHAARQAPRHADVVAGVVRRRVHLAGRRAGGDQLQLAPVPETAKCASKSARRFKNNTHMQ